MSAAGASARERSFADRTALAVPDAEGGAELLRLAAAQRMSTESRRAVFCVVMGSQDAVDASERLLRLPLKVLHCLSDMISRSAVDPRSMASEGAALSR